MLALQTLTLEQLKSRAFYENGQYILTDEDLTEFDFTSIGMVSDFVFFDCNLNGSNLSGVTFESTAFNGGWVEDSKAQGIIFKDCELKCVNFDRSDMKQACFINTEFYENELHGVDLENADFSGNDLINCHYFDCNLANSNFSKSKLTSVLVYDSDLTNANLQDINANNFYIDNSQIVGAKWTGTNMEGVHIEVAENPF